MGASFVMIVNKYQKKKGEDIITLPLINVKPVIFHILLNVH